MNYKIVIILILACIVAPVSAVLTEYGNCTQFNISTVASVGTVSNYQILVNLSNMSGVSDSTVLYTNGTTLPTWTDIAFTTDGDVAVPFWPRNNTYTANNISVYIRVPSITTTGNNTRFYFGNSSKTTSIANIYNTADLGDDFLGSAYNVTQWVPAGTPGSATVSNGYVNVTGGSSAWYKLFSNETSGFSFGANKSVVMRWAVDSEANRWNIGMSDTLGSNNTVISIDPSGYKNYSTYINNVGTVFPRTTTHTTYAISEISRNGTATSVRFYENDALVATSTTNLPTKSIPATIAAYSTSRTISVDWILVRNRAYIEPTYSDITHLSVANVSGFTPQDVWMEGQYNRTFHITSSSDGTPLAATYITSDGQSGTASTLGYAYVTEGFGVYTITVSMEGYATKTVSFIVDEDGTTEIQLTPATTPSQNTNIIYTPHQVRVYTVDAYGVPLIGTNITINYIASTLPTTDTNWLINAYGIESSVAADMVNSSVAMTGISGDDGSNTFTLFGSLTYGITLTNATVGANCYKKLAPIDASYRIYCPITGQTAVNNTLTAVNTSKLVFYKLNTSSYYNLSMIYEDQTGYTTNLVFNVYDYSAGRTLVYTKDWGNPGISQVVDNYTVYIPLGKEYRWQYNATKV